MRFIIILLLGGMLITMVSCQSFLAKNEWKLSSPDENVTITFKLATLNDHRSYPVDLQRIYYSVEIQKTELIQFSALGIRRDDQSFVDSLSFISKSEVITIDETYQLVHGKRSMCRNHAKELTLTFRNNNGARVELIARAYDDGVAFRYRFPESDSAQYTVTEELTGFKIPQPGSAYMQPYDEVSKWTPAYEDFYQKDLQIGASSPTTAGWSFPALFNLEEKHWLLLTEAEIDGSYCGTRLQQHAEDGLYKIRFPDPAEGNSIGAVNPVHSLPWQTPWRVIMVGNSLAQIVESTLVTDLSAPSAVENTDWIKPGRVSWSWWSEQDSPQKIDRLLAFVDLAAEMNWEYSLVDANWNYMEAEKIERLAAHAKEIGVGLIFWYNSGGPHNEVTEAPRDRMMPGEIRRKEFQWLKKLGAKGVKVDFFQSDKQNIMQHYLNILKDAADFGIMVNFHGCTLPRGWDRTYPHMMTLESVKGAECYLFNEQYPDKAPWHNTVLAFTRNVVGPMDYTPVTFSDNTYPHITSYGHELALSVVFESGWIHLADRTSAYSELPDTVKNFLKNVPAAWDDTKYISGKPGTSAVLARRKGSDWYIGGINGMDSTLTESLVLPFPDEGEYEALLITDGENEGSFHVETSVVTADEPFTVAMRPYGGFVMHLSQ